MKAEAEFGTGPSGYQSNFAEGVSQVERSAFLAQVTGFSWRGAHAYGALGAVRVFIPIQGHSLWVGSISDAGSDSFGRKGTVHATANRCELDDLQAVSDLPPGLLATVRKHLGSRKTVLVGHSELFVAKDETVVVELEGAIRANPSVVERASMRAARESGDEEFEGVHADWTSPEAPSDDGDHHKAPTGARRGWWLLAFLLGAGCGWAGHLGFLKLDGAPAPVQGGQALPVASNAVPAPQVESKRAQPASSEIPVERLRVWLKASIESMQNASRELDRLELEPEE